MKLREYLALMGRNKVETPNLFDVLDEIFKEV